MKKDLVVLINIFIISFLLNFVWENAQRSLYIGYQEITILGVRCLLASLGDAIIITFLYGFFLVLHRKFTWFSKIKKADYVFLVISTSLFAILFEKFMLATDGWQYTPDMPIVPIINVGLVPVLQMIILPVITIWIIKIIYKRDQL